MIDIPFLAPLPRALHLAELYDHFLRLFCTRPVNCWPLNSYVGRAISTPYLLNRYRLFVIVRSISRSRLLAMSSSLYVTALRDAYPEKLLNRISHALIVPTLACFRHTRNPKVGNCTLPVWPRLGRGRNGVFCAAAIGKARCRQRVARVTLDPFA